MSQQRALVVKNAMVTWGALQRAWPAGQGRCDPPPLLCPGWNTVFSSELGSPRKAVNFYESPEEGHKDGEGPGVSQDRVRNLGLLGLEKTMREILPMLLNI